MVFFKRKKKLLDLRGKYLKDLERTKSLKEFTENKKENNSGNLGFFGTMDNLENPSENKLEKGLSKLTEKLEELSNQIYHLEQRMEVLEAKLRINRY